ncbi:hypothetical protein F5B19DRAFT_411733 [Rostrohypoxylon terebratum]|nr:hypothetical protein F5B19DRAFT_411733 [Rostrohypoxylon terebratum]
MSPSPRFIVNEDETLRIVDANQEFLASLDRLTTDFPPVHTCSTGWKFEGFYNGPTSIAYLFYRLSQIFPVMEFKQQYFRDWAEAYLDLGARRTKRDPTYTNCGITNETLAYLSLTAVMDRDINIVRRVCSFADDINYKYHIGADEWMYGRAGYLYFLRLCGTLVKETEDPESGTAKLLDKAVQDTMWRILDNFRPHSPYGKNYSGAAHGTIGTITQLFLTDRTTAWSTHEKVLRLLEEQLPSGNFPPHARRRTERADPDPDPELDQLVQFCHGAPGFNIALRSLLPLFPQHALAQTEAAMARAETDIWRRGVLAKNPCLCHGIPGNALALHTASHERFLHFLSWMSDEEMRDRGWLARERRDGMSAGLYTGEAGRVWVWAVAVRRGPRVLIGFNDI